jgi:hypothetical protein
MTDPNPSLSEYTDEQLLAEVKARKTTKGYKVLFGSECGQRGPRALLIPEPQVTAMPKEFQEALQRALQASQIAFGHVYSATERRVHLSLMGPSDPNWPPKRVGIRGAKGQ